MTTVLSTKRLKSNQRSLLLQAGVSLVEYNAINIEFLSFEVPVNVKKAIFTSQNAVENVLNQNIHITECFCVGEKTKELLEKKGQKVVMMKEYATELAAYLVEYHKEDSFHFFCGNIRSNEIPTRLKENTVNFNEIVVYKTTSNPKQFERRFDAILFYSPSGVRSFCKAQNNKKYENSIFVCIGTTTAAEAENYSENVVISNSTTVESVIAKAVKILKQ